VDAAPGRDYTPPGPPRGPWVGYCGAVAGAVAAQDPDGVCPRPSKEGEWRQHSFTDQDVF
jgi:hypothetical protein